jgi:T3SS negative regulator,GrlR
MLDGLWTLEFEGVPNFLGGGIVVLIGNHLYGGDSQYYYNGLCDVKNGKITGMVQINAFVPAPETVFGTHERQFSIQLAGTVEEKEIKATVIRSDNPSLRLQLTLNKRADLA